MRITGTQATHRIHTMHVTTDMQKLVARARRNLQRAEALGDGELIEECRATLDEYGALSSVWSDSGSRRQR